MKPRVLALSVIIVILGGLVFYSNYDQKTIVVSPELDEHVFLDYYATEVDPFAHHLIVDVETDDFVTISETLNGNTSIISTDDGRGRFTVDSGQMILVVLENPDRASGTVKTTFYCDIWNYAAYILLSLGSLFFMHGVRSSDEDLEEEL